MPGGNAARLSNLRKRREIVKGSLTKLYTTLMVLETTPDVDHAKRLVIKLEEIDKDFKAIQFDIIDLLEEGSDNIQKEQETIDNHEDEITAASLCLQKLVKPSLSSTDASGEKQLSRKLARVERCLRDTDKALASVKADHDDVPLLEQYQEQISDVKRELSIIYNQLIVLDLPDTHALVTQLASLETLQFECSHKIKRLLSCKAVSSPSKASTGASENSKLPKLDIPTSNGNVLCWQQFWEQFEVSVHSRSRLSNAEKLVYLQQAVKNGSARTCIEGLTRSGDHYNEAVECLKGRYNRPRLIYHAHVRTIMESPSLKEVQRS